MPRDKLEKIAERYLEQITDKIEKVQDERDLWEASMHFTIAILMQERDLPKEALKDINKALKLSPDDPDYYYTKAEILLELEKPKETLRSLHRCIELEDEEYDEEDVPQNPSSFMLKSDVYHDLGKYKTAIDYGLKAIQMFKKQKIIKDPRKETLASAIYRVGHDYLHLKKYKESLKWLEKAEKQKPHDDIALICFDKADALIHLKRYDEAWKMALKSVDNDSTNGEFWLMYAYCMVLAKKESYNVLRAFNFSAVLAETTVNFADNREWIDELNAITRYLKNADEDKMVKFMIKKIKKSFQEIKVDRKKPLKK